MSLFQLKPVKESFLKICRNFTKRIEALILCEGEDDVITLKTLVAKMAMQMTGNIGITDCEGFPTIREIARYAATLARCSRRLKKIILIVDANEHSVEQRFQSIIDSLKAHQVGIKSTEIISESTYRVETENLEILIKIVGLMTLPFQSHAMEDYSVQLLISCNRVQESQLRRFHKAKDFLNQTAEDSEAIIMQAQNEMVHQAFENIINLLNLIA